MVELATGLMFITVFSLEASWIENVIKLAVFCIYIAITIYDFRHKIIPDGMIYAAILLTFVLRIIGPTTVWDWLAGPILFTFFASIWLLSRGRAMGFGDAKLALSIGWLLGAAGSYEAVALAFWIGAIFGIAYMVFGRIFPLLSGAKRITMKSEIPFAPFLVLGAWLALIFNLDLLNASFL